MPTRARSSPAPASLYRGAAVGRAGARSRHPPPEAGAAGRRAEPGEATLGLPLPHPLPLRHRPLQGRNRLRCAKSRRDITFPAICAECLRRGGKKRHGGMGLCHRGRRLGGLRAGQPADRGSGRQGAAARGGSARQVDVDRHSRRLHQAAQPQVLQLELRDGGRGGHGRPAHSLPARPHARRLELDQRHALCARPAARLRHLGPARQSRLVLFAGPALLQEVGEFRARRRRQPRQGRPAERRRHVRYPRAVRRLHRCRGGERLSARTRTTTTATRKASATTRSR